jgi:hypothetical protein
MPLRQAAARSLCKCREKRLQTARAGVAASALAGACLLSACSDLTPLSFRFVANQPPPALQVTQGDYVLTGAVDLHLADQSDYCGTVGSHFVAALLTDDGERQAVVSVSVPSRPGVTLYRDAFVFAQVGINTGALQNGVDPNARAFATPAATARLDPDSSGSVAAVLRESKLTPGPAGRISVTTMSNGPTVNLKGRFRCVAANS